MSTITINATMEVLYYTIGIIGSFKIMNDLFKPKEKKEIILEEDYYADSEEERRSKYWHKDGSPITTFDYDRQMYLGNDDYASYIDDKIVASGYYYDEEAYDEEYEPDYGQYCNIEQEEKRAE